MSKCTTKFCRGVAHGRDSKCPKCKTRTWKANNPATYAFNKLKYRAKERGIDFTLTIEEFKILWEKKSGALGKTASCLSFDRIDPRLGYSFGNIEVVTLSENVRRRWVPFFKNKEQQAEAIAEIDSQIAQIIREEGEGVFV